MAKYGFLLLLLLSALATSNVRADGQKSDDVHRSDRQLQRSNEADESDPRLPPALPGEEVQRNGKKMKLWSTSGSPSEQIATPPAPSQNWTEGGLPHINGQPLSVIVEEDRRGHSHQHDGDR